MKRKQLTKTIFPAASLDTARPSGQATSVVASLAGEDDQDIYADFKWKKNFGFNGLLQIYFSVVRVQNVNKSCFSIITAHKHEAMVQCWVHPSFNSR